MNNLPQLLTPRQLAERWGVCVATIHRNKNLKPIRFNSRTIRFELADIEAYEKSCFSRAASTINPLAT